MLELNKISKSYGTTIAVTGFTAHFQPGQCAALIGPSGCGKSTVLRIIAGLLKPDGGTVKFNGTPLNTIDLSAYRHHLGYVIQEGGLFPHLTARANVSLVANYLRWPQSRIEQRIRELTDLTQLTAGLLDQYPTELSGGQRQRVSLIRALMLDPDLLLLDEPLGALDPIIRYDLQQELRHVFATLRKTVVMVTHDLAEAAYLGDTLFLMQDGQVLQRGSFDDFVQRPAGPFVEKFVSAQRNPLQQLAVK